MWTYRSMRLPSNGDEEYTFFKKLLLTFHRHARKENWVQILLRGTWRLYSLRYHVRMKRAQTRIVGK